jgi:hypothetical protein
LASQPRHRAETSEERDDAVAAGAAQGVAPAVAAAYGELRAWIALLELVQRELLRSAGAIEASPGEEDPEVDLDRLDVPTEVRAVLRNVAGDHLRPAVEDLKGLLPGEPAA